MLVPVVSDRLMSVEAMTSKMGRQSYQDNGSANSVLSSDKGGINDRSFGPEVISG
ncbi:hypothetical protein DPMN_072462 [Dreissena polymorpha]|uniref:Uncharacterized protein n=1 Tax=Dreissena polymorpha TaxID=45954 RepID=A0A9D3Z4L5_DREPO|nr:hypothetical protein DPMN_072462 [Dreissena polymorpha]